MADGEITRIDVRPDWGAVDTIGVTVMTLPLRPTRQTSGRALQVASDPARVWTKEELLRNVWGFRSLGATRTLDSHACRLRQKLGAKGDHYVVNVWGVGYRLVDGPVEA